MGDFIINYKNKNHYNTKKIIHLIEDCGFKQIVNYDHSVIVTTLDDEVFYRHESIKFRNLHIDNISRIKLELIDRDWKYECSDLDMLYNNFINQISSALNKIAPQKNKTVRWNNNWYNSKIKEAQNKRDNAYKKFKLTRTEEDWTHYKHNRNKVIDMIKSKTKIYLEQQIDMHKKDTRKM